MRREPWEFLSRRGAGPDFGFAQDPFCLLRGEWTVGDKRRSRELREEDTAVVQPDEEGT